MSETPKTPTGLGALGKDVWKRAWESSTINIEDYDALLLLCKMLDERRKYEIFLSKKGNDLLWINGNTNLVMHPYVKRVSELDKSILATFNSLGMTAAARAKMGIKTEDLDAVDNFISEYEAGEFN